MDPGEEKEVMVLWFKRKSDSISIFRNPQETIATSGLDSLHN